MTGRAPVTVHFGGGHSHSYPEAADARVDRKGRLRVYERRRLRATFGPRDWVSCEIRNPRVNPAGGDPGG